MKKVDYPYRSEEFSEWVSKNRSRCKRETGHDSMSILAGDIPIDDIPLDLCMWVLVHCPIESIKKDIAKRYVDKYVNLR